MDVTLETLNGGLEAVTIGQIVPAGSIDGRIDNVSNWVSVASYIGVGRCLGGEVMGVPDAYEMSLRMQAVDSEPSFGRMPQT